MQTQRHKDTKAQRRAIKRFLFARLCAFVSLCLCVSGAVVGQQSPASQRPPQTLTPQSYPPELVLTGQTRFASECGFCHGRDAAGGENGPDLTRSTLVAEDSRGDKIRIVVRSGRVEKGMPSFDMSEDEIAAIVAFIHNQKTKSEAVGGGRRSVDVSDLETGDAEAGRRYFNGAGGCARCHSPSGDLAGVGTRFRGLPLLERMLYPPSIRPGTAPPKATVTVPSEERRSPALWFPTTSSRLRSRTPPDPNAPGPFPMSNTRSSMD